MNKGEPKDVFDVSQYTANIDKHTEEIDSLSSRIKSLEDKYSNDVQLGNTLYNCSQSSVKVEKMINDLLVKGITSNPDVKKSIVSLVDSMDKHGMWRIAKGIGAVLYTLALLALGAWLQSQFRQ